MSGVDIRLPSDESEALDCLIRALAADGAGKVGYDVLDRKRLPGSTNLIVRVSGDVPTRELFVKRLRAKSQLRHEAAYSNRDRPRVKPVPDPASRLAHEAAALMAIEAMVAQAGRSDWFAVPVLSVPECPNMLVLDRVDAPTVSDHIDRGEAQEVVDRAARSMGEWLQTLHSSVAVLPHARPHLRNPGELAELAEEMIDFIGSRRLHRRRTSILDAIAVLPSDFELVPSHGDFAPQNVFVTDDGRIAVFDTTASLLLPRHFDPAYFAVVLEFAGFKRLLPRSVVAAVRLAEQVRDGYGPTLPPRSEILTFELVLLLDRWCSVSRRPARSARPVDAVRWARRQGLALHLDRAIARRVDQLVGGS